jgi:hypothetical protein
MSAVYMSFLEGMTPECGVVYVKEMLVKVKENNIDSLVLKAFTLGQMAIIQLFLLDARTDPRFNDDCCFKAACVKNHFKLVVFMIKQFPDIDPSRDGNLALRNAVIAGFYNLVRELLADPRVLAIRMDIAVDLCIQRGDGTMMDVFLDSGIIKKKCKVLAYCSYLGKTNCVAALLRRDVSANWNCGEAIRMASEENMYDCLRLMLYASTTDIDLPVSRAIVPVDKTYTVGEYALLEAVKRGYYNIVRLLLEFTAVTKSLQEPFFTAIEAGHAVLVELFLKMPGLTLSESTNFPYTNHALMLAAKYDDTQVLYEILRDHRMTHPDQVQVYVNALRYAIKKPNHDVLLTLLEQPPDSVSIDETHSRLMRECVSKDKMGALKILLDHNALAMAFDEYAVVLFAVGKKSMRAVQLFLDCPAIQPFVERPFPAILRVAIAKESLPLVRMILLDGRVHPRSRELYMAVANCSEDHGLDLLRALCEVMTSNPDKLTVCMAILNKKYNAVACLREYFDVSNRGVLTYTAGLGDVEMVRSLLQDNRFRAELEPQSLGAACTAESWQNAREIVVDLLGRLDPAFDGSACLTAACMRRENSEAFELVQLFIEDGRANIVVPTDDHPAMLMAINLGRSSLVSLFVDLHQTGSYANYLQAAVLANQLDIVQLLFPLCPEAELFTHEVRNALVTALSVALDTGETQMFNWLSSTGYFDLNNDEFPEALHDTWVHAIGLPSSNPTRAIVMGLVKRIATKYIRVCLRTTQLEQLKGEPGLSAKILAHRYRNMIKPNLNTPEERQIAAEATLGALFLAAQEQAQERANAAAAANVEAESIAAAAAAREANAQSNAQSTRPRYGERSSKRLS